MRLHRFLIKQPIFGEEVIINEERLLHQWSKVFRFVKGDRVGIFDGGIFEYIAEIESLENKEARLKIISKKEGVVPKNKITLCQSLIKKDKFEWAAEKAVELGVSKIIPIISERSEKKDLNLERLNKIIIEAAEQCGRTDVPEISKIVSLEEALENTKNIIVFDKSGSPFRSSNIESRDPSIFIGPEGGWSEKEIELFKNSGAQIFSLGNLTLRAETAAVVALGIYSLGSFR